LRAVDTGASLPVAAATVAVCALPAAPTLAVCALPLVAALEPVKVTRYCTVSAPGPKFAKMSVRVPPAAAGMVSTRGFGVAVSDRLTNRHGQAASNGHASLANWSTVHTPSATQIQRVLASLLQSTVASHRPEAPSVMGVRKK
jgi:hypothetical protein